MPIATSFMERLVLLRLNQAPGVMLDFLGVLAFKAVSTGLKLGVFETLKDGPLTARETAERIKAGERGTSLLLEALRTIG